MMWIRWMVVIVALMGIPACSQDFKDAVTTGWMDFVSTSVLNLLSEVISIPGPVQQVQIVSGSASKFDRK